jgi:uncharacterized membrane protein
MGDFAEFMSFRKMMTPILIQILFWIGVVFSIIGGIVMIVAGASTYRGGPVMVLAGLFYLFLGPIWVRVWCELLIVFFRIEENTRYLRPAGQGQSNSTPPPPPGSAGPQ